MRVTAFVLVATLALPSGSLAQTPASTSAPAEQTSPAPTAAPGVDVSRLGVSLDRIRRGFAPAREEQLQDGAMKLSFTVQVLGQAPKIDLLQGFSLSGPLPYGAPTHREMIEMATPQVYRAPVVPFSAIAVWAAQKVFQRSKKERCEEELATYKQLVMSGVAVSAPTCTQ